MALIQQPSYQDGDYSTPKLTSRTPRQYPFAHLGDLVTAIYSATYEIHHASFTPTARGTVDPDNAGFYLIAEGQPQITQGRLATFVRTYSSIPTTQVTPTSSFFTRPNLDGYSSAASWCVSFDGGKTSWRFTARKSISSVGASPVAQSVVQTLPTGVTCTITQGSTSKSFSTSSTASSIQSTLAGSFGSLNVDRDDYHITIRIDTAPPAVTTFTVGPGCIVDRSSGDSSGTSFFKITPATPPQNTNPSERQLSVSSHGYSAGTKLAIWNGDELIARTYVTRVVSSSVIAVPASVASGDDFKATHVAGAGVDACTRYVNGSKPCSMRHTQDFYLPGVTAGITTAEDIPLPVPQTDPASWLDVIEAATAWPVAALSELTFWQASPILVREVATVQLDDALDTLTP